MPSTEPAAAVANFPDVELLADIEPVAHREADDRVSGGFESLRRATVASSPASPRRRTRRRGRAVDVHVAERLALDRDDPRPRFAGRLRDQLLRPGAERAHGGMGDDGQFVASAFGQRADRGAETHGGRILGGTVRGVGVHRVDGAVEDCRDVVARQRRRNHAEVRQRGIAAADVRIVDEDAQEAGVARLVARASCRDR